MGIFCCGGNVENPFMNSVEKQLSEVVAEIVVSELREGFLGGFRPFFSGKFLRKISRQVQQKVE